MISLLQRDIRNTSTKEKHRMHTLEPVISGRKSGTYMYVLRISKRSLVIDDLDP